jgi:RES domain-containing protein
LIHDAELLDRLAAFSVETFRGEVFRATRRNLDPVAPSTNGGRWAPPGAIAILYTSLTPEGALAEVAFHWSALAPRPTKPVVLHRIKVSARRTLRLGRGDLSSLGVVAERYAEINYSRTQQIGAAAAFLGLDGIVAPSARWQCDNLILFTDNLGFGEHISVLDKQEVDWLAWAREHKFISDP